MRPFRSLVALASLIGLAITFAPAHAQGSGFGPKRSSHVAAMLNIEAERAEQVDAILEGARAKERAARARIGEPRDDATRATLRAAMAAIGADTDRKLASVLTPAEMKRLRAQAASSRTAL